MSHEITKSDKMFSVRETPWHGLGDVLENDISIETARTNYLNWNAGFESIKTENGINIKNHRAVVRKDNDTVLGVVGNVYEIYQNSEMWDFIDGVMQVTDLTLETAGSLKGGRTTWVMAKRNGGFEVGSGDPIENFFLFRNGFDGSTNLSLLNTNVRVVCNNTLSAAIKGASNCHSIRHTKTMQDRIKVAGDLLTKTDKYEDNVKNCFAAMFNKQMSYVAQKGFLEDIIFPESKNKTVVKSVLSEDDRIKSAMAGIFNKKVEDIYQTMPIIQTGRAATMRTNKIEKTLELLETGAGSDLPGVRGTAWGLYNATTEYFDHEATTRTKNGGDKKEAKFVNSLYGTGAKAKEKVFNQIMAIV